VQWKRSDQANGLLTLALSAEEKMLLHAMKSTSQVGLAALFVFQHIFKAEFESRGVSRERELLREKL
jgi:hypothetical protein